MEKSEIVRARTQYVVKSNDLIQYSTSSLSALQQKVVLYVISKINKYDEDFKEYTFKINEFCEVCGIERNNGKNIDNIKKTIVEISSNSFWLLDRETGRESLVRWIEMPTIDKQSGTIGITINKYLKPYLLQLQSNFTMYQLYWVLLLKSKYAIRLFELAQSLQYDKMKEYTKIYNLDDLRRILGAENLQTWQHFNDRCLTPAVKEVSENTDTIITTEPIKDGRTVTAVKLTIFKNLFMAIYPHNERRVDKKHE